MFAKCSEDEKLIIIMITVKKRGHKEKLKAKLEWKLKHEVLQWLESLYGIQDIQKLR